MTNELAIRIITGDVLGTSEQTHEAIKMTVKALSQSEPQKGKWVTISDGYVDVAKCDQCGKMVDYISNYCPNCGAEMENGKRKE